jgi:hypothetical protein
VFTRNGCPQFKLKQTGGITSDQNNELRRAKHDTTAACRQGKVHQVYIKSKFAHSTFLDTVNF